MIAMYFRMFLALLTIVFTYIAIIYFIPITGEKIDDFISKKWNSSIVEYVDSLLWKAQNIWDSIENKIDNPAPNTSENIKGRTWQ